MTNPRVTAEGHVEYDVVFNTVEVTTEGRSLRVRWIVKHRYKEFAALDSKLRSTLGAKMAVAKLPPSKMFGSKDPLFIRERQSGLNAYLQAVLNIHGVTDFSSHLGSADLREFMLWGSRLEANTLKVGGAAPSSGAAAVPTASSASAAAPAVSREAVVARHKSRSTMPGTGGAAAAPGYVSMLSVAPEANAYSTASPTKATAAAPAPAAPTGPVLSEAYASAFASSTPAAPAPAPVAAAAAPRPAPAAAAPAAARPAAPVMPPPPRPPAAAPAAASAALPAPDAGRSALLSSISSGAPRLKKAVTNDRSAPAIKKAK